MAQVLVNLSDRFTGLASIDLPTLGSISISGRAIIVDPVLTHILSFRLSEDGCHSLFLANAYVDTISGDIGSSYLNFIFKRLNGVVTNPSTTMLSSYMDPGLIVGGDLSIAGDLVTLYALGEVGRRIVANSNGSLISS